MQKSGEGSKRKVICSVEIDVDFNMVSTLIGKEIVTTPIRKTEAKVAKTNKVTNIIL